MLFSSSGAQQLVKHYRMQAEKEHQYWLVWDLLIDVLGVGNANVFNSVNCAPYTSLIETFLLNLNNKQDPPKVLEIILKAQCWK